MPPASVHELLRAIEALAFGARRALDDGDAVGARLRWRELQRLAARLPEG